MRLISRDSLLDSGFKGSFSSRFLGVLLDKHPDDGCVFKLVLLNTVAGAARRIAAK